VESFILIFQGHRSMSKKSQTHLNNVSMFLLSNTILLLSVRARNLMRNPDSPEKRIFSYSSPPIRLNVNDLAIKHTLNKLLKFKEIFGDLRFLA
jgi:hypothetical protein